MHTAESTRQPVRGIIIGRFHPPHNGHRFLIDFSQKRVDELTIFLCSLPDEPIPGGVRYQWMRELFPDCRIVHFSEAIPEAGRGNPDAHRIWAEYISRNMPHGVQRVFASEEYGQALAQALGAEFVPVDVARSSVPVSGSAIRRQPLRYWDYLPAPVRAYYRQQIRVIRPRQQGEPLL